MIRDALRYIQHAPSIAAAVATDPVETWLDLRDNIMERRERGRARCPYVVAHDWERRLHEDLDLAWPCNAVTEFWTLWPEVVEPLNARGVFTGPAAFGCWNDGEPELVRAMWCLCRHLRPATVVETGVARGFTSRFILEALERNGSGHLWSIDRPPPLEKELHKEIGVAVEKRLEHRWSYIRGSSRRRLPGLLSRLVEIDLFVHDSRHSEHNVRFELDRAWSALRPGGVLVVDDIDLNWGFNSFTKTLPGQKSFVCQAKPVKTDPRRFDGKGLFGVIRKEAALECGIGAGKPHRAHALGS